MVKILTKSGNLKFRSETIESYRRSTWTWLFGSFRRFRLFFGAKKRLSILIGTTPSDAKVLIFLTRSWKTTIMSRCLKMICFRSSQVDWVRKSRFMIQILSSFLMDRNQTWTRDLATNQSSYIKYVYQNDTLEPSHQNWFQLDWNGLRIWNIWKSWWSNDQFETV